MLERRYRLPVHPSWLVAALCLGIVAGLIVSSTLYLPFGSFEWLFLAAFLITFSFIKKRIYVLPLIIFARLIIDTCENNYQANLTNKYTVSILHATRARVMRCKGNYRLGAGKEDQAGKIK